MRARAITSVALTVAGLLLAGCENDTPTQTATPTLTTPMLSTPAPKQLPSLVGMGLQSAQDAAQQAGFFNLASHDSLGRTRTQILDRNWKVCFQTPAPGLVATDQKIDLGAVKLEEECPAKEAGPAPKADVTMPDFAGKALSVARQALDLGTSILTKDVSGMGRIILLESNWKVCRQSPSPGTKLAGQPVTLSAVKFEEPCP